MNNISAPVTVAIPSNCLYFMGGTSNPAPPKPKRKWTGNPKGKTKDIQEANIRKRISYNQLLDMAKYFRSRGISADHLPCILTYILNQRRQYRGFRYSSNGYYAQQSLEVLIADILDYNKREELGLN